MVISFEHMFEMHLIDVVVITSPVYYAWHTELAAFFRHFLRHLVWIIVIATDAVICLSNGHACRLYVISTIRFKSLSLQKFIPSLPVRNANYTFKIKNST